ncbi:unnamed protein product [Paramecium pentaurelia]|uniref:signal-recognition-particle GTPase n=1 Tax=Paramecium pentaurelia TaxID=43138 RepID=A0A8S1SUA1_9CILI|nr:unnamed protein product [Paramecium pentaurelia]
MVLKELGQSIKEVLNKLNQPQEINENFVNQILKEISLALLKADVNVKLIQKLRENIKLMFKLYETEFINLQKLIQKSIIEELNKLLKNDISSFAPKKGKTNIIMFIGIKGSGKTSTCSKYAYYYQKRGWKVGIVSADTYSKMCLDQIQYNAKKIRVPFYGSYTETDPVKVVYDGVEIFKKEGIEIILIDTPGRHQQQNDLFEEMKQIDIMIQTDNVIFVMDSQLGQSCCDQALAFKSIFNLGSIIITKLDGHAKGGGAISSIVSTHTPIDFVCDGESFEDFQEFQSSSFIIKLLGLEDLKGLIKNLNSFILIGPKEKQFTLRDLESELKHIIKFGSINFLTNIFVSKVTEQEQIQNIKRNLYIMNSMTSQELDGEVTLSNSRIKRIAKGSGTTIEQVNYLIKMHKVFVKVQHPPPKDNFRELMSNGFSQQLIEDIQKDPKLLQKLDGYKYIQDMMKQIGNIQNNK